MVGSRLSLAWGSEPKRDTGLCRSLCALGGLFGLTVSEPKTEIMCLLPKGMEECQFTVSAGDQTYKQTDRFVYLGRTITADGKVDKEIANRICRAWRCFRRHSVAMYDRRRANLWLKVQLPRPKWWRRSSTGAPRGV